MRYGSSFFGAANGPAPNDAYMTSRSDFLGVSAAAAALPALASGNGLAPSALYDFAAIDAALARPARHRRVFATARIADGSVVGLVTHGLDVYETTLAQGPGSLHPAIVFYGRGVVLGLNDAMWHAYRIAEGARRRGEIFSSPSESANPFASRIGQLAARGTTLFVCDTALADWSHFLPSVMGAGARRAAYTGRRFCIKCSSGSPFYVRAGVALGRSIFARSRASSAAEIAPCTTAATRPRASTKTVSGSDTAPYDA